MNTNSETHGGLDNGDHDMSHPTDHDQQSDESAHLMRDGDRNHRPVVHFAAAALRRIAAERHLMWAMDPMMERDEKMMHLQIAVDLGSVEAPLHFAFAAMHDDSNEEGRRVVEEMIALGVKRGDPNTYAFLAADLYRGQLLRFSKRDDPEVLRKYVRLIRATDSDLCTGIAYLRGFAGRLDPDVAVRYFRRAAEAGNAEAQFKMFWSYSGVFGGKGSPNPEQRAAWLLAAANNGHAEAQAIMGSISENGRIPGFVTHPEDAIGWYIKGAMGGSVRAYDNLVRLGIVAPEPELESKCPPTETGDEPGEDEP